MAIFVYINKRKVTFFSARSSNFSHFSHQLEHSRSPFSFLLDVVRDWKKHFIFRCNIQSYTDQVRIFHYSINMNIHIVFSGLPFWSAYFIYGFICISLSLSLFSNFDWQDKFKLSGKCFWGTCYWIPTLTVVSFFYESWGDFLMLDCS